MTHGYTTANNTVVRVFKANIFVKKNEVAHLDEEINRNKVESLSSDQTNNYCCMIWAQRMYIYHCADFFKVKD